MSITTTTAKPPKGRALEYNLGCPKCGSSDAVTRYSHLHKPGVIYEKCFSCGKIWDVEAPGIDLDTDNDYVEHMNSNNSTHTEHNNSDLILPDYDPCDNFWNRGIDEATYRAFDVRVSEDGTAMFFPHHDYHGNLVGIKRKIPEAGRSEKYRWLGSSEKSGLFGHQLWKDKGNRKYITVTEGQEDAMACYQMFGGKFAVVSIKNGADSAKSLSPDDLKFLREFDEIVVCFDSDEPGRKAAREFAKSFSRVKVSIIDLSLKDANEYLKLGRDKEFRDAWWKKKPYRPESLVFSSETKGLVTQHDPKPDAFYAQDGLNKMLWGIYRPSLVVVCAGSGTGKSSFLKDLFISLFNTTDYKIGCMFLEESVKQSIYQIMSIDLKKNINNPDIYETAAKSDLLSSWEKLFSGDRWMFWDHFGSSDLDSVCDQVRYLSVNFGAQIVCIDHISIIVSSQENGDERKALDAIMTRLRSLCEELSICIVLVSHLKRPNSSDSLEEGGVTSLSQLRGSAGIGQLADVVLGLERNGQAEDEFMRNLVTVRVLKSRKTGRTGPAAKLIFDPDTVTFTEVDQDRIDEHLQEIKASRNRKKVMDEPIMDDMLGQTT